MIDVVPAGMDPLLLDIAGGDVWTLNLGDGTLTHVDPATHQAERVDVGEAVGLTSDGANLWIAVDGSSVVRLDGVTGRKLSELRLDGRPLFEPRDAGFLGFGQGSLWLTVPELDRPELPHTLWRIEPESGRVIDKFGLGRDPLSPLVDGRYVWVSSSDEFITRVDTEMGRANRISLGGPTGGLAAGGGAVWVAYGPDEVWRLEPSSAEPLAKIAIDEEVRGLAFGDGFLWVATEGGLKAIDPSTDSVVRNIPLITPTPDHGPIGIAHADGSVWVSVE